MVKLMRTPPSEVVLQSARLVAGQRADIPSLLDLDARLLAELVATLAQTELTAQKADQQQFRSYYWIDLFCQPAHGPKAAARARTEEAKERAAIRRAFGEADVERSGSLAMDGFAAALRNVGVYHPEALLRELLASLDVSGRCTRIELPEFEAVVS